MDEALAFVRSRGVQVGDDIRLVVNDKYLRPNENAHYGETFSSAESYTWDDMLGPDGQLFVRIRAEVLESADHTLFVLAHEMHEINALRSLFGSRQRIPGTELIDQVKQNNPGNLHSEANEEGSNLVLGLRKERK